MKLRLTLALLLSLFVAMPVTAQGTPSPQQDDIADIMDDGDLSQLPGIEQAVGRMWRMASPVATPGEVASVGPVNSFTIMAMQFETDADAKTVFDAMLQVTDGYDDVDIEESVKPGDASFLVTSPAGENGNAIHLAVVQNADTLIIVADQSENGSPERAMEVATFITEQPKSEKPVKLVEDGTSTGGLFDRLPKADNDIITGFEMVEDMDLLAQ